MKVIIDRFLYQDKQTLGKLTVYDAKGKVVFTCCTLELAELDNAKRKSCIPADTYTVKKRTSEKYGQHFHILNVDDRDFILIHTGNYYTDLLGCIAVGATHTDINKDGYKDVTSSVTTMKKLLYLLPNTYTLTIKE